MAPQKTSTATHRRHHHERHNHQRPLGQRQAAVGGRVATLGPYTGRLAPIGGPSYLTPAGLVQRTRQLVPGVLE